MPRRSPERRLPRQSRCCSATDKIDINTASIDRLKTFPGIGDAYSKRIVGRPPVRQQESAALPGTFFRLPPYNKLKNQIIATQPKK